MICSKCSIESRVRFDPDVVSLAVVQIARIEDRWNRSRKQSLRHPKTGFQRFYLWVSGFEDAQRDCEFLSEIFSEKESEIFVLLFFGFLFLS